MRSGAMIAGLMVAGVVAGGCSRETKAPAAATPTTVVTTPTPEGGMGGAAGEQGAAAGEAAPTELVVWADGDPPIGDAPLTVKFTVEPLELIEDPVYTWNFGDGSPEATGAEVMHTYTKPGTYTARVTVRDAHGNTGTDHTEVEVEEPAKERS